MAKKFTISIAQTIIFPKKCAVCGSSPQTEYEIQGAALSGFSFRILYSTVSYQKASISIPVCRYHYFVILLVRFLMFVSCAAMIGYGLVSFFSLTVLSSTPEESLIFLGLFFVSVAVFIISIRWQPIRLKDVGGYSFTLYVRSDRYADEISSINGL